jgi:hypothetical protein
MKNKLLLAIVAIIFGTLNGNAQLLNSSLDNWGPKTTTLVGIPFVFPTETHTYNDPIDWSTGNQATTNSGLGNGAYVTQDTVMKYEGYSSARLESNSITLPAVGTFVIPGVLVNGSFVINPTDFAASGGLDPFSVPGTGSRVVGPKPASLVGYFNYIPSGADSCQIIAALVDASRNEVARATFEYGGTTAGFVRFEVPFNYISCNAVDTMIIIASSSPFSSGVGSGVDGSVLWVDSLAVSTTPAVNVPPMTMDDSVTTLKNTPVTTTTLLTNDVDCEATTLSLVSIAVPPVHGTATPAGNNVTYVPALNYVGADQYTYQVQDGGGASATGIVFVNVNNTIGIAEIKATAIQIFPNPANVSFTVTLVDPTVNHFTMTDIAGNVVMTGVAVSGTNKIETSTIANGLYILNLVDNYNNTIGVTKVTVHH